MRYFRPKWRDKKGVGETLGSPRRNVYTNGDTSRRAMSRRTKLVARTFLSMTARTEMSVPPVWSTSSMFRRLCGYDNMYSFTGRRRGSGSFPPAGVRFLKGLQSGKRTFSPELPLVLGLGEVRFRTPSGAPRSRLTGGGFLSRSRPV